MSRSGVANESPDLEGFLRWASRGERGDDVSLKAWVELAEAWRITRALKRHRGNRAETARELGIGRRTLYAKMEKLGIAPSWSVEDAD
jgi:DNA-binding NtrC family response regulator